MKSLHDHIEFQEYNTRKNKNDAPEKLFQLTDPDNIMHKINKEQTKNNRQHHNGLLPEDIGRRKHLRALMLDHGKRQRKKKAEKNDHDKTFFIRADLPLRMPHKAKKPYGCCHDNRKCKSHIHQ